MFEELPKLVELGALGLINFVLIFKGIGRMQDLTDSINKLVENVGKLQSKTDLIELKLNGFESRLNGFDSKLSGFEPRLGNIEQRMSTLEQRFSSLEETIKNELRNFKYNLLAKDWAFCSVLYFFLQKIFPPFLTFR